MTDLDKLAKSLTKEVPGYSGKYMLDELGNVYSLARTFIRNGHAVKVPARKMARTFSRKGYPQVTLHKDGTSKTFEVHRLVCRTFLGESPEGFHAAHLDGDKTNPALTNLKWASISENRNHMKMHGTHLHGERVPNSVLKLEQVLSIFELVKQKSNRAVARELGVDESTIRLILNGKMWAYETLALRNHLKGQSDG